MKTYCVKCRRDTENIDPKMVKTKTNRLIMQSICSVCEIKKSRLYVLVMSRTRFRVNPHSIVA